MILNSSLSITPIVFHSFTSFFLVIQLFICDVREVCWRSVEPWCWRRFLRVPWTARRSNKSILKEAETPILWPPDVKNWLIGEDPDAGKDWRQEAKGTTEHDIVGYHHQLNGHDFGQALGVGDGQGGLACCSPWGLKDSDMTAWLNWTTWEKEKFWPDY